MDSKKQSSMAISPKLPFDGGALNSSHRTVISRSSFGGGFHFPKRQQSPLPSASSKKPSAQRRHVSPRMEETLPSVELELNRVREEALELSRQLNMRERQTRILHVDPPHMHPPVEVPEEYEFTLEELEVLKERQSAKLFSLQAEYKRRQEEDLPPPPAYTMFDRKPPRVIDPETKAKRDIEKARYQARFENYRAKKAKSAKDSMVKGREFTENHPAPRTDAILKWMFHKLDKDGSGAVDKLELMQEFHENPELAEIFGMRETAEHPNYLQKFNKMFSSIGYANKNELSFEEFMDFFQPRKEEKKKESPHKIMKTKTSNTFTRSIRKTEDPVCLLTNKQMALLESVFNQTDIHKNLAIPRADLIAALLQDEGVIKILSVEALQLTPYQTLDLETMLMFVQTDVGDEFITWNQFAEYFFNRPTLIQTSESGVDDPRFDEIHMAPKYMQMIKEVFDSVPLRGTNKVSTHEFVQALRQDPQVKGFLSITARQEELSSESVSDVLTRISSEASSLVTWNDILGYFSYRGKPKRFTSESDLADKSSFVRLEVAKKKAEDAFAQTEVLPASPTKPAVKAVTFKDSPKQPTSNFSLTIPQAYSFDVRDKAKEKSIRQQKFEAYIQQIRLEEEKHLNFKYSAKPIPSEVIIPKYESMLATQEARRLEVKRKSIEMTKASEKPFNFYTRDLNKPRASTPEPPKHVFKANPIPWACTVKLYESMMTEQKAAREERVARAAQESLRKASLPPRMELYSKTNIQSEVPQHTTSLKAFTSKKVPNFTKLHASFQRTLDAKKKAKMPTKPEPFSFAKTEGFSKEQEDKMRKDKIRNIDINALDEPDIAHQKWGLTRTRSAPGIHKKPKIEPTITAKYKDTLELRKKEKEKEREKELKLKKEEEERQRKYRIMKDKVQSYVKTEEAKRPPLEEKRVDKADSSNYKNTLKGIKDRVNERPLLSELVTIESNKDVAKKKTLLRVKQSLVNSKINIKGYFTQEELDLIEEAEYEVKKGSLRL